MINSFSTLAKSTMALNVKLILFSWEHATISTWRTKRWCPRTALTDLLGTPQAKFRGHQGGRGILHSIRTNSQRPASTRAYSKASLSRNTAVLHLRIKFYPYHKTRQQVETSNLCRIVGKCTLKIAWVARTCTFSKIRSCPRPLSSRKTFSKKIPWCFRPIRSWWGLMVAKGAGSWRWCRTSEASPPTTRTCEVRWRALRDCRKSCFSMSKSRNQGGIHKMIYSSITMQACYLVIASCKNGG